MWKEFEDDEDEQEEEEEEDELEEEVNIPEGARGGGGDRTEVKGASRGRRELTAADFFPGTPKFLQTRLKAS